MVYIAFVDLLKAFDNVNMKVMMKILKMIKIGYRDRRIIRELYKHQTTSIKRKETKKEAAVRKEKGKATTYRHCYVMYTENKLYMIAKNIALELR